MEGVEWSFVSCWVTHLYDDDLWYDDDYDDDNTMATEHTRTHTQPSRTYYLEAVDSDAQGWVDTIRVLQEQLRQCSCAGGDKEMK